MKIKNIIKKGFTVFLIVLSCFGVLSSVCSAETSEAASGSSGGGSGVIRGDQKITTAEAINFFCSISNLSPFDISRSFPDILSSDYGVKIANSVVAYYFWKDNTGNIHYRADESDGSYLSCCDNAHVTSDLSDDTTAPGTITGADLKAIAADYNSRYVPITNPDEYYWSYQKSSVTKSTSKNYYGFFEFTPLPPIYTYTRGTWGNMGWSDLYILAYLEDDDVGCYYSGQYIHFYPSKSDDITYLNIDYYSLSDNTLTYHAAVTWPTDRPYIALQPNTVVYTFPSHYDYIVNTNFKSLYSPSSSSPYKEFCYLYNGSVSSKTKYAYSSSFDPVNNTSDDCGFILSNRPFELFLNQTKINFDRIPDNYVITINGDTIYDYSITNPDTGYSTTINNYITNNYTIPASDDPTNPTDPTDPSDPTSPSVTGNVTVSGNVDVSGKIEIDTKPIDINVNVNGGGSSGTVEGVQFDQDVSLNNYYNWMNDQTTGFSAFMSQFFSWLPPPIITLLCAGFACVIIARFLGR